MDSARGSPEHIPAPQSPSRKSHSCNYCVEIIQQLMQPPMEEVYEDQHGRSARLDLGLGWLDSVIANTHCSLCRLIQRVYEQTRPDGWAEIESIYCQAHILTRLTDSNMSRDWKVNLDFFYRKGPDIEGTLIKSKWQPAIQLVADDASLLELREDAFQLGCVISSTYPDPEFLRICTERCLNSHGDTCEKPDRLILATEGSLPFNMRFIDIKEHRVCLAPPSCSYAILSYVWGQGNFLRMTKANCDDLMTEGILQKLKVPQTISDAMQVAKAVGFRYLWVDAVCILQDDETEKVSQIEKMDKIYSKAALTIVAFFQSGADDGLWPRGEQVVEDICGLRFIGTAPGLEDLLQYSPWQKRGWTFQELVLSRRVLFFAECQTYFQCEYATFAQDQVYQVGVDGQKDMEVPNHYDTPRNVLGVDKEISIWRNLISGYTGRTLSFESDGLNAVSGVAQQHARKLKDGLICGLLVSTVFEAGLMWHAAGPLRRRAHFPSWSWVGWVGQVQFESLEEDIKAGDFRIVQEWSLEYAGGILRSTDLNFPLAPGSLCSRASPEASKQANELLPSIQTGILCFTTMSATFQLDHICWTQLLYTNDGNRKHCGLYKIVDKGVWIGSVHLTHMMLTSISRGYGTLQEFIVLSGDSGWFSRYEVPQPGEDFYRRPTKKDMLGIQTVPLYSEELLEKGKEEVYNIMLIVREPDGIAYRAGIGAINRSAFEQSDWMMRDIRLG